MNAKSNSALKKFIALDALKRSLVRVRQQMLFQLCLSVEPTAALVTLEGSVCPVLHHVVLQVAGHRVRVLAQSASVRPISRVDSRV